MRDKNSARRALTRARVLYSIGLVLEPKVWPVGRKRNSMMTKQNSVEFEFGSVTAELLLSSSSSSAIRANSSQKQNHLCLRAQEEGRECQLVPV